MKKVYCAFDDKEYIKLTTEAEKLGFSVSKLVEYAAMIYVDMPRKDVTSLAEIQSKIYSFLQSFVGDSFICATPFGTEWSQMSTSAKRTAAAQFKRLEKEGVIEKIQSESKHHEASRYKKRNVL